MERAVIPRGRHGRVVEHGDTLDAKVTEQALRALGEADLVLLVLDTTTGLTGDDTVVAQLVRRAAGSVIVVANKVDSDRRRSMPGSSQASAR